MFQPNQQIGHYTLISLLGKGGFGEVWLAKKPNDLLHPQVALKLPLDPNPDIAAITKEAQTWLHAGHHPNVVPVIGAEIVDGQVLIASEYVSGGSLAAWLKRHGGKAPSVEAAVAMATGILSGLEHLHNLKPQPIIHRDLKPDNVLLKGETPRLTDFGISRVLKTTAYTQHSAGTPSYMPPEAFEGKYSAQSDIWAVGVMLYQMLTGSLPFPQNDIVSLFGAIKQNDFAALPPHIPEILRDIIKKALAKDPEKRFASAAKMRDALNEDLDVTPTISASIPTPVSQQPSRKGKTFAIWFCIILLPICLVGFWFTVLAKKASHDNLPVEKITKKEKGTDVGNTKDTDTSVAKTKLQPVQLKIASSESNRADGEVYFSDFQCNALRSGTFCEGKIENLTGHEYHNLKLNIRLKTPLGRVAHFQYDLDVLAPQQSYKFNKALTQKEDKEFGLEFDFDGHMNEFASGFNVIDLDEFQSTITTDAPVNR